MEPLCLCLCADSISAGGMRSPSSPRPSREESASRPTTLWGKTAAFRCSTLSSSEYWREFPCSDGPEDCQETADLSSWPCLLFVLLISHVFAEFQTCFCPSVKTRWGQQRGQRWFTTREKPPNSESASRIVSSSSSSSCFCFVRRLYLVVFSFFFTSFSVTFAPSYSLRPVLGADHRLHQPVRRVLLHGHPPLVPHRVRLDPRPVSLPASGDRELRQGAADERRDRPAQDEEHGSDGLQGQLGIHGDSWTRQGPVLKSEDFSLLVTRECSFWQYI